MPTASSPAPAGLTASAYPHPQATPPMWRDELTGRIQKFRRKRARMQGQFDPDSSLDLDFEGTEADTEELASLIGGQVVDFGNPRAELDLDAAASAPEDPVTDTDPELPSRNDFRVLSNAAVQAGERPISQNYLPREPVEIVLDSRPASAAAARPGFNPQHLMSRRLNAGLVDAGILLAGGAVFAGIFAGFGVKSAPIAGSALNVIALGVVAACIAIFYFGFSVMLSRSTPGMAWLGLEIRNLDGNPPTAKEAWSRAVCYLISASALFLGFIWALLDSDSLTWHDLMSGTCIVEREN